MISWGHGAFRPFQYLTCSRRIQFSQYQLPLDSLHTVIRSSYAAEEYIIPRPSSSNRKFARWLTHTISTHHQNAAQIQFNVRKEDRDVWQSLWREKKAEDYTITLRLDQFHFQTGTSILMKLRRRFGYMSNGQKASSTCRRMSVT
jgi:hypothetical protein